MKKMMTTLLALGTLAACSKTGQEPQPINPTPSQPKPEQPAPTPNPTPPAKPEIHYIASIERTNEARQTTTRISYQYDSDMRLTTLTRTVTNGNSDAVYMGKLTHTPTQITMTYDEHQHHSELNKPTEFTINLDQTTGHATNFVQKRYFTRGNSTDMHEERDFTFDEQGMQTSYTSSFMEEAKLTWQGGNLTDIFYKRPDHTAKDVRTYTQVKNNIYPDLNLFLAEMFLSPDFKYLFADKLGMQAAQLIESSVTSYTNDPRRDEVLYTYEQDEMGRPIRIIEDIKGSDKYIHTITYVKK